YNRVRLERADSMQNLGIVPIANGDFEEKRQPVDQYQCEHCGCVSELSAASGSSHSLIFGKEDESRLRSRMAKPSDVLTQFTAGMQNLDSGTNFSGSSEIALLGKFRHFSQSNCREEQEKEPCQTADVSGSSRPENPGYSGNRQHNERREPPTMVSRA